MPINPLGPLDWRIPIVTPEGRPTSEFQRRWLSQIGNNSQIGNITVGAGPPPADPVPADGAQYADTSTTPYTIYIAAGGVWNATGTGGADPTATASDVAVIGTANTYMRSDSAPAIQKASSSQFGLVKVDGTTITETGGVISSSASGGGTWKLLSQTGAVITSGVTYSFATTPVAQVAITGLAPYNELLCEITDVSATLSGFRGLHCSVDNGATFYNTTGDYQDISSAGAITNNSIMDFHASASAGSRSGVMYCPNPKMSIGPKYFHSWTEGTMARFSASTSPINAVRVAINTGIMNTGYVRIYGKS